MKKTQMFDEGYRIKEDNIMEPYQCRMFAEYIELVDRKDKLYAFIKNQKMMDDDDGRKLDSLYLDYLKTQLSGMNAYADMLIVRMNAEDMVEADEDYKHVTAINFGPEDFTFDASFALKLMKLGFSVRRKTHNEKMFCHYSKERNMFIVSYDDEYDAPGFDSLELREDDLTADDWILCDDKTEDKKMKA